LHFHEHFLSEEFCGSALEITQIFITGNVLFFRLKLHLTQFMIVVMHERAEE
jgi:hypothetical protein